MRTHNQGKVESTPWIVQKPGTTPSCIACLISIHISILSEHSKICSPQSHYCSRAIALAASPSMAHSSAGGRPLLPRPYESLLVATSSSTYTNPVMPPPRKPKTRTKTSEEWEEQADKIRELYEAKNLPLEAVIRTLEEQYGFQAS